MALVSDARTITPAEHQQLLGLVAIARDHQARSDQARDTMQRILGVPPEQLADDPHGVTDVIWADRELSWLLDRSGITIVEPPPPTREERERADLEADVEQLDARVTQLRAALRNAKTTADDPGMADVDSYGGRLGTIVRDAQLALEQDDLRAAGEVS